MTKKGEESALATCLSLIEEKLDWGNSTQWTNYDFEKLSEEVNTMTGVRLSVTTLKRIWGKLKYESAPTLTTLNTLARFIGHADWRSFTQLCGNGTRESADVAIRETLPRERIQGKFLYYWILLLIPIITVAYVFKPVKEKKVVETANDKLFTFRADKVLTEGVPNSVVFHYDARAAKGDSVFIVQTWDSKRKKKVRKDEQIHSAIYYYPGYFRTKLIADNRVVRTHDLWITSNGWLCLAEDEPFPFYFKKEECVKNGVVEINEAVLKKYNLSLHPKAPGIRIFNQRDFGDLCNDSFIFETSVKNDFKMGTNACQSIQVLIQCKNDVIIIPLASKACVGNLSLSFCGTVINSENADLSGFGADLSQWTKLRVEAVNKKATIYVNDIKAYALDFRHDPAGIVGLQYRFNGTGAVKETRFEGAGKAVKL